MMNFVWVIPWAAIIIFAAGWHFGGKNTIRKEKNKRLQEDILMDEEVSRKRAIAELHESIHRLEERIERMFASVKTKEEN